MSSGAPPSEAGGALPPAVRALWARVSGWGRALSRPARVLIGTTVAAGLLIALGLGLLRAYEPYGVLFSQLEQEDAGAIVAKLKELHVPYRVAGANTIEVPESRVGEVRLELASAGLPRGGGVGFESFDTVRLGATEFEQRILYRRAMEGELARTISGIDAVRSARVHLVMPEHSVFAGRREPASASITLHLRPGRTLGPSEVGGIVHLIAAAVPGLSPDQVALVTSEGIALHRPRAPGSSEALGGGGDPDQPPARTLESTLEERTRLLLERLLGTGHVDVRVSADLDLSRVERTEDRYDPGSAVLRSEEATIERTAGPGEETVAGVPGAESNLPAARSTAPDAGATTPALAPAPTPGPVTRETHTRNFEVGHVQEKQVSTSGVVRRLTVAVVVDGVPGPDGRGLVPRPREELDKVERLVRSAVGALEKRGDVVTVESVPFPASQALPDVPEPPRTFISTLPAPVRRYLPAFGVAAALGVMLVVTLVAVRRARRRAATAAAAAPPPAAIQPQALSEGTRSADDIRDEVVRRVKQDPATAALVLRGWIAADAGEKRAAS